MIDVHANPERPSVFVYEHVSGGGMADTELPDSWLAEGRAMLEAAVTAFADAGCDVVTTIDPRVDFHLPVETIRIESPNRAEAILSDMLLRTDFGLIIAPETGGVLHRLTLLAERNPGWNLGSSAEAVALCGDKIATSQHLIDRNGKPIGTDFSNVYAAGVLTLSGKAPDAYDPKLQHAAEIAVFEGRDVPFFGWHYPPFFLMIAGL